MAKKITGDSFSFDFEFEADLKKYATEKDEVVIAKLSEFAMCQQRIHDATA